LPTVSLSPSSESVCEPNTINLTSKISSPNGSYTYNWYTTSTNPPVTTDLVFDPSAIAASGTFYVYAFNNSSGCKSASPVSFSATVNADPSLSLTSPSVGCSGASTSLEVAVTNGVSSPTYQWKIYNQSNGNWDNVSNGGVYSGTTSTTLSISTNTGLDGAAYYCAVTASGCSANSSVGVIGVSQPNVPTATVTHPTCSVSTGTVEVTSYPQDLQFSISAPSGYQSSTTFSTVAADDLDTNFYTLTVIDFLNCTNSTTISVNPQKPVPNPPTATNAGHCVYSYPTGSVSDVNGFTTPTFKWYTASTNGTLLQSSTATTYSSLVLATTTYHVSVVHPISTCESSRSAVTDTVIDPISIYNPFTNDYIWKGGAVGNLYDWMTSTNWVQYDGTNFITVNQVPASTDNVIIPPSSRCISAQPTVNGAADQFINIDIKPGGVLTVSGSGVMNVSGNWTNNGTFNCGTGTVNFVGSGNHFIQGANPTTFYNLVVNKPLNGVNKSVLKLNTQAYITGQMTLTAGLFDIYTFDVNMDARTINGGSTASYVQTTSTGRLQRDVASSSQLFPVGRSSYTPATLTNSGTSDKYSIRVVDRLTNIGTQADNGTQSDSAVVKRTWMIDENVIGGSNVTLRLDWNGDEHQTRFDQTQPYITHYNTSASKWENKGWSTRTCSNSLGFVQTTGITSFSPFGISSPEGGVSLPVEFIYLNSECKYDEINLEWATASEHNSSHFNVLASIDGDVWREISQVSAAGNSNERLIYKFILSKSNNFEYVKLNQFDVDGRMAEFGPFKINCFGGENDFQVYPNPVNEKINIQLENKGMDSEGTIRLISSNGQEIISEKLPFYSGSNLFVLKLEDELQGVYFIEFMVDNKIRRKKRAPNS